MPYSLFASSKVAAHDARVRRAHGCVGRPSITLAPRINQREAKWRSATHIAHCQPGQTLESIATVPKGQPFTVMGGDIGGTNARLCFWSVDHEGHVRELARQVYPTSGHGSLEECVADFCQRKEVQQDSPSAAAFALAGPVEEKVEGGRRCRMTNLGWDVHASSLAETLATALPENRCRGRVQILNDFEAIGYGIPVLGASDLDTLHAGEPLPKLFYNHFVGAYSVEPSEGSHADFPPRGEQQRRLASFAEQELGTSCEIEQVVAGFGLARIYRFVLSESGSDAPADLAAAQISAAAIDGEADAVEAMRLFMAIIGAEAGHMALRTLARGGVYLAGGILPKVADGVRDKPELNLQLRGALMQGYLNEGSRFCDKVVRKCPFHLVMNSNVGLLGSQQYAIREVEQLL